VEAFLAGIEEAGEEEQAGREEKAACGGELELDSPRTAQFKLDFLADIEESTPPSTPIGACGAHAIGAAAVNLPPATSLACSGGTAATAAGAHVAAERGGGSRGGAVGAVVQLATGLLRLVTGTGGGQSLSDATYSAPVRVHYNVLGDVLGDAGDEGFATAEEWDGFSTAEEWDGFATAEEAEDDGAALAEAQRQRPSAPRLELVPAGSEDQAPEQVLGGSDDEPSSPQVSPPADASPSPPGQASIERQLAEPTRQWVHEIRVCPGGTTALGVAPFPPSRSTRTASHAHSGKPPRVRTAPWCCASRARSTGVGTHVAHVIK
jgi:hypothetical protein